MAWIDSLTSPYGTPAKRKAVTASLLSASGAVIDDSQNVIHQIGQVLNDVIGLGNVASIRNIDGTRNTLFQVEDKTGQRFVLSAPGERSGEGAYVARPGFDVSVPDFLRGNRHAEFMAGVSAAISEEPDYKNDWVGAGAAFVSPFKAGMVLPEVTFDKSAYHEEGFFEGIAPYLSIAAMAVAGWGITSGNVAAASSVAAAEETIAVGAMSVPGTYGAMSTTAAIQSPWWSIGAASEAAAGGFTLGTVTDALKTTKTAVDAAGMAGKLFGSGAGAGTASSAPAGSVSSWLGSLFSSNPTAKGYSMETPQGLPNAAATPQNIVPLNSGSISPALLLAGLGLILYLVKS